MGKQVKINKADAIEMFTAIGFTTANKWTTKRLQSKANRMDTAPDDSLGNKKLDELVDLILSSENILIVDEVEETKKKDTKAKTKAKTEKKAKTKVKTKAKTEKKAKAKTEKKAKAKTEKKAPKEKKLTIDAATIELLKKKPITLESVIEKISKLFPGRDSIARTMPSRLGGGLKRSHNITVKKDAKDRFSIDE